MVLAARRFAEARGADLLMVPAVAGACLLGALSSYAAYGGRPLAVLALVVAGVLVLVTLARPSVGVAVGMALYPLGVLGLLGEPGWVAPTAWTALLFGLALARWDERPAHHATGALTPALVTVLAVALVSLAAGGQVDEALPILRSMASGAMLYIAVVAFVDGRSALAGILAALTFVGLLVGGLALSQYASGGGGGVGFFSGTGALVTRVDAGFAQPNQLAGFLVLLVPFLLAACILRAPGRWIAAAATVLAVLGIALTFSRSALIALVVIPLFFVRPRVSLLLAPVVAVLLVLGGPDVLKERFSTLSTDGSDIATRADFWRAGITIFSDHPLLGVGPGGFPDAYSQARLPGKEFLPATIFEPPPHAHNILINTGAEQGLLGVAALALLVVAAVRVARRARTGATRWAVAMGRAGLAATTAFFVNNLFDVTMLETTGTIYLALMGLVTAATGIAPAEGAGDG